MKKVTLVEVGLRDGLQNEHQQISVNDRIELARRLVAAGLPRIELGAFVRADRVPQMRGSSEVIKRVMAKPAKARFSALVPNMIGMREALTTSLEEVAVFTAASESFARANINCSIDESFHRFEEVIKTARAKKILVRGYLSTCFGCPFDGEVPIKRVIELTERLLNMGCYEVSLGDTIGVATPGSVEKLLTRMSRRIPLKKVAGHFRDTRGTALVNILRSYQLGVRVFDTSLGGLGGCPYAPGATGNVATEDVVYMFEGMGVGTGASLAQLIEANHWFSEIMDAPLPSKMARAGVLTPRGQTLA